MLKWIKQLFVRERVVLVNLPALRVEEGDAEELLKLRQHPGLRYFRAVLGAARGRVETALATESPESLARWGYLQGLRTGLKYVDDTIVRLQRQESNNERPVNPTERKVFEQARGLLKEVK